MLRWWFHLFIILLWVSKSRLPMLLQCAVTKVLLPFFNLFALEPCLQLQLVDILFGEDARRCVRQHCLHEYENDGLIKACHLL